MQFTPCLRLLDSLQKQSKDQGRQLKIRNSTSAQQCRSAICTICSSGAGAATCRVTASIGTQFPYSGTRTLLANPAATHGAPEARSLPTFL